MTTWAIGDIHGNARQFERLLHHIKFDAATDQLIILGDVIDRGPDSKRVMEMLLELHGRNRRHVLLRGNHENMVIRLSEGYGYDLYPWLTEGGRACLWSYGIDDKNIKQEGTLFKYRVRNPENRVVSDLKLNNSKDLQVFMRLVFSRQHLVFLRSSRDHYTAGDFMFVHDCADAAGETRIVVCGHEHLIRPHVGPKRICIGLDNNRIAAFHLRDFICIDSEGTVYDIPLSIVLGPTKGKGK